MNDMGGPKLLKGRGQTCHVIDTTGEHVALRKLRDFGFWRTNTEDVLGSQLLGQGFIQRPAVQRGDPGEQYTFHVCESLRPGK
jgi:hypothetical protein